MSSTDVGAGEGNVVAEGVGYDAEGNVLPTGAAEPVTVGIVEAEVGDLQNAIVKRYDQVPRMVEAVQFVGTKESQKYVVDWARSLDAEVHRGFFKGAWNDQHQELTVDLDLTDGSDATLVCRPGFWLVRYETISGQFAFTVLSPEQFDFAYRLSPLEI